MFITKPLSIFKSYSNVCLMFLVHEVGPAVFVFLASDFTDYDFIF